MHVGFRPAEETFISPKKILAPGDVVSVLGDFEKLNLTEPAGCNTTSENTANGLVYTTKISGKIYDDKKSALQHRLQVYPHSYLITDVYKNKYLIGTDKKPYPEIVFSPTNDANPSGMRLVNFEITWISTLPPIDIIDL